MKLEFFGAAGEVTGSCHVITVAGKRILLDCGLIQGGRKQTARNRDPWPFDPASVDAVVLSHAHIDHSGRLPLLIRDGFDGPVYTQRATRDLCRIMLKDAGFLAEKATVSHLRALRDSGDELGYDPAVWREMVEMGWAGIAIAEAYGGLGYGYTGLGLVLEQAGHHLSASPLQSSVLVGATVISELGSEAQKESLLPEIAAGTRSPARAKLMAIR